MTVKTGQAWAGLFVTLDATGAASAADSTPTGTLYVDGVSDAATVTITGSNPYKFAVTLPSLTAGQRVDMYIAATIDTIATAGIVASEQADTSLLSDGVTLADDAITSAKFDENTAYPLKSADTGATALARTGADSDTLETLSDQMDAIKTETASILEDTGTTIPGTITTIDNEIAVIDGIVDNILEDTGTTLDTKINTIDDFLDTEVAAILTDTNELQTDLTNGGRLDVLIDAIKAKTDNLPASPAQAGEYTSALSAIQADLDNPNQYKADVSGLPTAGEIADSVWDEETSGHTTATTFGGKNQKVVPSETINDYKADVSGLATSTALSTVSGLVDDLETRLTAARAGYLDNLNTGVALTSAGIDAIMDEVVVGTYTMRQLLTVFASALAGKLSGGGTTTLTFRGINDASDVIVATVDANGNRSDLTITV